MGMHVALLVLLPAFCWLTWWQLTRAEQGNTLSWAYVVLWPAFAGYAVYTWWQLVHDQAARIPGRATPTAPVAPAGPAAATADRAPSSTEDAPGARPPGWALTGGRARNVAIAAEAPIDSTRGGRGERFAAQTPEEAARLAEYNRYLASLAAEDAAEANS
jgi:DNA-binding transcriptional regulator of glucitol operon